MILIVDFGSQTCHLISRRTAEMGVENEVAIPEDALRAIRKFKPAGIIFSGGPSSVYDKNAPTIDKKVFSLNIPILGICYGQQLIAYLLGGKVNPGKIKEYGPTSVKTVAGKPSLLFKGVTNRFTVWMSHGDEVVKLPKGFQRIAKTENIENAAVSNEKRKIYAVQFHPEVKHTRFGKTILKNFVKEICNLQIRQRKIDIEKIINSIKKQVGNKKVVCAVSGGVDSTAAAALIARAIGANLHPVYVESGLMRTGTEEEIISIFKKNFNIAPIVVRAENLFLEKLKGVSDPEEKRKIIGKLYIELFEKEAKKISGVKFLAQGTIYSDVIESRGTKNASKIKSHHNVGGLPEKLGLELLEPLRNFYKDEVRAIGKKLGLPEDVTDKQPFPGPGQAIRIVGEVTKERLIKQQKADKIVIEEIKRAGLYKKVFQSFPILTGIKSTAVKGDARVFAEVVALRIYDSGDIMTASWSRLPYSFLEKIALRIVNEVPDVSRVVYDITTKPPATMEWE